MDDKVKIVVIDDEEDILFTIKEICEFSGYEAYTADSGEEGIKLVKEIRPKLVIVDYHMPGLNGLTTVKRLKELVPELVILVLTVDERQEISDKFMAVGATDFAIKPIKAPDLIARIKVNLHIYDMHRELNEKRERVYLEKGISVATLNLIKDYIKKQDRDVTISDITKGLHLAYQTVHRYLQYMLEQEQLEIIHIYGKLGRPKNRYRLKN
ncbi:response regulator [Maledivibacter halophilus]|uniref:Stage 0 sporulation protein A homolog n=1 Tax=Maledivibacter halophilus TaxID=36842 RepID=A0A1T5JXS1_9FIRM|nr:response regulator [Maledivibacter halophilus]SKC56154.1 Response regulator of citrate/malate metabolism [Maledivibacter halophilus]